VHNIDEVKQRLLNVCHGMDHSAIYNTVGGAENAGAENAGVEKSGAMTDGEPSV